MNKYPFLLLAVMLCNHAVLNAQTTNPECPPGPLIQKRAPDFATWKISSVSSVTKGTTGKSKSKAARAETKNPSAGRSVTITKTNPIIHASQTDAQGQKWNIWWDGTALVVVSANGGDAAFVAPPGDRDSYNPLYFSFSESDFPDFGWVSKQTYTGTKMVDGRKCLVFDRKPPVVESTESDAAAQSFVPIEACIDAETRLPVSVSSSGLTKVYSFEAAPTAMQVLPESVRTLLESRSNADKQLERKPGKPY